MRSSPDQAVVVHIDQLAWHEGMKCASKGGSTFDNPYPLGSAEAYSWLTGFIESSDNMSAA
jgi:hypothetical protein